MAAVLHGQERRHISAAAPRCARITNASSAQPYDGAELRAHVRPGALLAPQDVAMDLKAELTPRVQRVADAGGQS